MAQFKSKMKQKRKPPVWKGPERDGVTQTLLGRYLACKERFRIMTMEGLRTAEQFTARIEYGNYWHICEEYHAKNEDWQAPLKEYAVHLGRQYPAQKRDVLKWYNVCLVQFPLYVEYWKKHRDVKARKPMYQEKTFCIDYELPSGRTVKLRGKWDAVDTIRNKIMMQENKSVSDVVEQRINQRMTFDLQTMTYLVALERHLGKVVSGVRYNVVLRPLSGGKGTIRPHKATKNKPAETLPEYYERLGGIIGEDGDRYFHRWEVLVSRVDVDRFLEQFLHPCLENLCDDYEWWEYCHVHRDHSIWDYTQRSIEYPGHVRRHHRFPYGVYNPTLEGNTSDLDNYLETGSTIGLQRIDNLFPEL